jgi:hypothetical protein
MTIFDQDKQNTQDNSNANDQERTSKTTLELVGEGKKFRSEVDLEVGYKSSQEFIEQMKQENKELREELAKRQGAQELMDRMREQNQSNTGGDKSDNQTQVSTEQIAKIVQDTITAREQARTATQNLQDAHTNMVARYGSADKAEEALTSKAQELGLDKNYLAEVAAQSPSAFMQLMGGSFTTNKKESTVEKNSVNTEALLLDTDNPDKIREYYSEMRRKNINKYFSPKVQNEIMRLVQEGKYKL